MITHQHMDHLGLLEILARRSGADVAALHLLTPYLEHFSERAAADDEFAQSVMRRNGVPEDLITVLGSVGAAFRAFGSSGRVTHELFDGDTLSLRDRTPAGAAPPRPQPLGHDLLGRRASDPDRRATTCSTTSPRIR